MNLKYQLLCVLVMALASYLPRVLPLVLFHKKIRSRFLLSLLYYIPYAVLAALTFPSIFYSTGSVWTALIGTAVALVCSLFRLNMALVALLSVAVVFGFGFIL